MSRAKHVSRRSFGMMSLALASLLAGYSAADAQTPDELRSADRVRIGVQVDFPPYGILNEQNQPDGFEIDVAELYAERLGVPVEIVQVTGPNRIPYLLTGRVDVLVASLSITPERAQQVQFSNPYVSVDVVLYGDTDLTATSVEELSGVSVAVPRASAQDLALTRLAPEGTRIQRFDDDPAATQALLSRQVQSIAAGTTVVSQIERMAPSGVFETKFALYSSVFGIAMRPNQSELLEWTNDFVATAIEDGSLNELHQKWFGKDLPQMTTPDYITN